MGTGLASGMAKPDRVRACQGVSGRFTLRFQSLHWRADRRRPANQDCFAAPRYENIAGRGG